MTEEFKSETKPIDIPKKEINHSLEKNKYMKEYMKRYKEENKEQLRAKMREKFNCSICQGRYTRSGKYLHNQTKKHKNYLNQLNE